MTEKNGTTGGEFDLLFHPLLWGLEEPHWAWLRDKVSYHRCPRDHVQSVAHDDIIFMMDGHISILHGGRVDHMEEGACTLGLFESATRLRGKLSFKAITSIHYYRMSREIFHQLTERSRVVQRNVAQAYEEEIRRLYRQQTQLEHSLEDFFISGNAGMVPGPYRAHGVKMFMYLMEDPYHELSKHLGKDLRLFPSLLPGFANLGKRYIIVHAHFRNVTSDHAEGSGHFFEYSETAVFIPTLARGVIPGAFCPELYPDSYLAIAIGRELYGFPKRFGHTWIHDQDHWNFIDLVVDGQHLARATWEAEEPLDATEFGQRIIGDFVGPGGWSALAARVLGGVFGRAFGKNPDLLLRRLWPAVPVHVRREVPRVGPTTHIELAVDELVMIPFSLQGMRKFRQLTKANVMFPTEGEATSRGPGRRCLTPVELGGRCLSAYYVELDVEFSRSRVLKKYH